MPKSLKLIVSAAAPGEEKRRVLKKAMTALLVVVPAFVSAQDYVMYETMYLKPDATKWEEFKDNLAAHNQKFHAEGPYQAHVQRVVNGPNTGQLVWIMGPCTFTHLDSRPSGDPHDSDWMNSVVAHLEGVGENEYWRLDQERSYQPNTESHPKLRVRFYDIQRGEMYRFNQLLEKTKTVMETKEYPNRTTVYRPRFWNGAGRDVATVWSFDSWADLDRDMDFADDYEEVHGDGSWQLFIEEWREVVKEAHDEYREVMPELGGASSED
jgi:hypothetical protein